MKMPLYELADAFSNRPYLWQSMSSCQGKIYSIGGNTRGQPAECYDPLSNTWTPLRSFNQVLMFTAVVTFQGTLYVIGGMDKNKTRLGTVHRYNPDTNLWHEVAPLSIARNGICAVADNNSLYAIGGFSKRHTRENIVERFDPAAKVWNRVACTHHKWGSACGAAVNNKVYIFGGIENEEPANESCERYDAAIDTWSVIVSGVSPITGFSSAVNFKGKICLFGVFREENDAKASLQMYDVERNEWEHCTDIPDIPWSPARGRIVSLRIPKEVLDELLSFELRQELMTF